MRLSILDLATVGTDTTPADALAATTEFARAAEALGYHRFWVAEHHGMPAVASAAPAVLIAHLAAATDTIRVGSGGVMLPNHSPLVIAEQFGTLVALHPGRIDLGLGRAPGSDQRTARALRRTGDGDSFPDDVVELLGYFTGAPGQVLAMPARGYMPEVWLLGSSLFSAQLAGMLGLPFSFAYHFAPRYTEPALAAYRSSFRPSSVLREPYVALGVSVLCAPSEEEARYLAAPSALSMLPLRRGELRPLATPEEAAGYTYTEAERAIVEEVSSTHVIGDPTQVRAGLAELVARLDVDEFIVSTRVHRLEDRVRSAALVGEAMGLAPLRPDVLAGA